MYVGKLGEFDWLAYEGDLFLVCADVEYDNGCEEAIEWWSRFGEMYEYEEEACDVVLGAFEPNGEIVSFLEARRDCVRAVAYVEKRSIRGGQIVNDDDDAFFDIFEYVC